MTKEFGPTQRQLSRKVEGIEYPKYVVVIPPEEIEQLGWKAGKKLKAESEGKKLIISPEEESP